MSICGRSVKFTNMVVLLVCFVMLWGCGGSNVEETPAPDAPAEEAASSAMVVNPNLAGSDELGALPGMGKELVDAIMAQRPFLGMEALHPVVSQHLGEEEVEKLYVQMFIPINLNTASEEEILLVPGVGKRMAHEFEEYRPYSGIDQLRREMGKYVDDTEVARMEQYVFVPIDLNTATEEEILAIPGVGKRMAHEFEEYRPYSSMEQFRREIGKYVDDGEVARLERYVEIRP
ncbi:MAG: helix-hairpin-helix domain-containing protein [Gemmatimonadetes bacterium]|nr:helix-hairpin-helix domain-containing protein [Gemmatimonadota bacterium]